MKRRFIILLSALFIVGCTQNNTTHIEAAEKYFQARNSFQFDEIKKLIADSLTIVEGDHKMYYSQDSFYEIFKWDSIFQSSYEIVSLEEIDEHIIASIALSSIRNRFLKNDLMTCLYKLSFESGQIAKIESLDCHNADWETWENRVNKLVEWIALNHPELDGFIHDMSMKGAINYLEAITLYESK